MKNPCENKKIFGRRSSWVLPMATLATPRRVALSVLFLFLFISNAHAEEGMASFYGLECCRFNPQRESCPTASGRSLRGLVAENIPYAASWQFPFGTKVKVTNLENGKFVTVVILDRGPNRRFKPRRIIDLSENAFKQIANSKQGVIRVLIQKM